MAPEVTSSYRLQLPKIYVIYGIKKEKRTPMAFRFLNAAQKLITPSSDFTESRLDMRNKMQEEG